MNGLSGWALTVSICAVIACIVEMLTSDTKLEKIVRFVLGAFMLCAVLIPLGQTVSEISDINLDNTFTYNTRQDFTEQKVKLLKNEICSLVNTTLSAENIYPQKSEVSMDIDDDMCISMVSVTVVLDRKDADKAVKTADTIKSKLGLECTVVAD